MPRPLGQHFLIRESVIHRIIQALELSGDDSVLEIGAGKGALTTPLITKSKRLLIIEKDPELAEFLESRFSEADRIKIINEDFLKSDWKPIEKFLGPNFKVISNLPYDVSTAILLKLLKGLNPNTKMILMFQKEVADRLLAIPKTKDYGSLSILTQMITRAKILIEVPPQAFHPQPKVESSVIKFCFREKPLLASEHWPKFETLLKTAFSHRRKMLRQNLKAFFPKLDASQIEALLKEVNTTPTARAEELSVSQWIDLYLKSSIIPNLPHSKN